MALLDINLLTNQTTTIDSSNANSGDTVDLGLASNATLIVDGVDVTISNVVGTGALSATTITANGGAHVTVDATVASIGAGSTFVYAIGANSSITVDAAALNVGLLNSTTVDFASANGTGLFAFNPGGINLDISTPPNVINVQSGDKIEVAGSVSVQQIGNTVNFYGALGPLTPLGSYTIPVGATYSYDGNTDTLTFTTCFLRGTRIRTPEGDVPVEDLRAGDLVVTYQGEGIAPVMWIGRRQLNPKMLDKPRDTLPVRICKDAIGPGVPSRDLHVSPDHCMFLEESLIPAKFLINGATITQETVLEPFDYFHIELEHHGIIFAEGARTETFLDLAGRSFFTEPGVLRFGTAAATRSWADWCYPPVYAGEVLERARQALTDRARELGYSMDEAKAS
jgi:hypothetical protein